MRQSIGFDVGGSTVRAARVDESGQLLAQVRYDIRAHDPESVLSQMQTALVALTEKEAAPLPIVVGFAGQLLVHSGTVAVAPNFGWRDVPLGDLLRARFGRPVRLVNDLDVITYGEARVGAGQGAGNVLCVFVGTGVGMGALVHDRLVEGEDGLATELGHIKVASPSTGRPCGCGERGCLEAYCGGRYLPSVLADKVAQGTPSPLFARTRGDAARLDAATLDTAATSGDPGAAATWEEAAQHLGFALGNMVTIFNPRVLIVGGGVLANAPNLRARSLAIAQEVIAAPARARVEVTLAKLGDSAGLVGAGLLAFS